MAEKCFCHVEINGEKIAVKDSAARGDAGIAVNKATQAYAYAEDAKNTAENAYSLASGVSQTATSALTVANEAKQIALNASGSGESESNVLYFAGVAVNYQTIKIPSNRSPLHYRVYVKLKASTSGKDSSIMVHCTGTKHAPYTAWETSNGENQIGAVVFQDATDTTNFILGMCVVKLRSQKTTNTDGTEIFNQQITATVNRLGISNNAFTKGEEISCQISGIEVEY